MVIEPSSERENELAAMVAAKLAEGFLTAHFKVYKSRKTGFEVSQKVEAPIFIGDTPHPDRFVVQVRKLDGEPLEREEYLASSRYHRGVLSSTPERMRETEIPLWARYRVDVHSAGHGVEHGRLYVSERGDYVFVDEHDGDDVFVYERASDGSLVQVTKARRLEQFATLLGNAISEQYGNTRVADQARGEVQD